MALIIWNARFETGLAPFDDHHKYLVELINKVAELSGKRDRIGDLNEVLGELVKYTQYHFSAEEEWMLTNEYPDYAKHHTEHEALLKAVGVYIQRFDKENMAGITDELLSFLKQWLLSHIIANDCKLSAFAKGRGTPPRTLQAKNPA